MVFFAEWELHSPNGRIVEGSKLQLVQWRKCDHQCSGNDGAIKDKVSDLLNITEKVRSSRAGLQLAKDRRKVLGDFDRHELDRSRGVLCD